MRRRTPVLAALLSAAACSTLGESGTPVAIEFLVPVPAVVDIGDTIQLRARVLDTNGDSIAATIRWVTPDTTVGVDSVSGRFWGVSGTSGRVQPRSGSLLGNTTQFAVRPRADTLIVSPAAGSLVVTLATDTASVALTPKVAKGDTGVADQSLRFTLIAPTPAGIRLSGDVTTRTVTTGSTGEPGTPIRVRTLTAVAGDSAIVQVEARRPSGAVVPGSGQVIRVYFQ